MRKALVRKEVRAVVGEDSILTRLTAGRHRFSSDEPPKYGGEDRAPDPYDYIVGGLGACTAISLKKLAEERQWPVASIEVDLIYEKLSGGTRPDRITRKIRVFGSLQPGELDELAGAAECSARNMLERGIDIATEVVSANSKT